MIALIIMYYKMQEKDIFMQKKQQFLRTEIIDKKYSPDQFVEYLLSIKENGSDIN